jgi:hypothetical protein
MEKPNDVLVHMLHPESSCEPPLGTAEPFGWIIPELVAHGMLILLGVSGEQVLDLIEGAAEDMLDPFTLGMVGFPCNVTAQRKTTNSPYTAHDALL